MKPLILILVVSVAAEEAKWAWGDEEKERTSDNRNSRYNVHEYPEDLEGNFGSQNQFRPQYPGPYGPNSRPIRPGDGTQILVGPDGPSGSIGRPDYRPYRPGGGGFDYNSRPVVPGANVDPISSGQVPSWIRNDPRYQEFDSCKCSRGFNCPGLKFGSCARGKQYCCFNSRKYSGSRPGYNQFNGNYPNRPYQGGGGVPFRPFNSIPPEYYGNGNNYNGDFDGDYYGQYNNGGYERPYNNHNRPYYGNGYDNGGYDRPYQGPYAPDSSGNYNPNYQGGGFNWQNPYNRPNRPYYYDNYGRSADKTKNEKTKTTNEVSTSSSISSKNE